MQMATRYLCLSGTLLGQAAESSCIFCINVSAVTDKHLTEIKDSLRGCSPWYSTGHTLIYLNSEKCISNVLCQELRSSVLKKKGYTTPLFSINKGGGAKCPLLHKRVHRQCHPLQATYPEHQMPQLFRATGREVWSQDLSNIFRHRVYVKLSLYLEF